MVGPCGVSNQMFAQGDYEDKRILMGSLFTKKVELGKDSCRTTQLNEIVEVLARFSKGCEGSKKRKAIISDSFSAIVPPSRPNMN